MAAASSSPSSSSLGRRYEGKTVVVTGGTMGIGFAVAERLGVEGAHVVICSRKQANVDKALDQLKSKGIDCAGTAVHVSDPEHRARLFDLAKKNNGHIDVLVSNVAVSPHFGGFFDTPETAWDKIFDVNVKAMFFLTKEALPLMRYGSSICYVASFGGFEPVPMIGAYTISKTAVLALTKVVAKECMPLGIRVNAIAPGVIKTKMAKMLWESNEPGPDGKTEDFGLGEVGEPRDCAGAVAFLCSPDARFMSGETLVMSGAVNSRL